MEGVYKTEEATPLTLIGWVDEKTQTTKGIKVPGLLSFLVYHDFKTPVKGFDQIPPGSERPPIGIVFQSFHIMIAMWGLMAFVTATISLYLWKKEKAGKSQNGCSGRSSYPSPFRKSLIRWVG